MSEAVQTVEALAPAEARLSWSLRLPRVLTGGALLLAVVDVVATSIGPVRIAPVETAKLIGAHLHLPVGEVERGSANDRIIWQVRLPRVLTAAVVGAALALAGASYQAVFRNPLADPYLLGVAAGAGLGATIVIVSPLPLDYYRFGTVALFAFLGAMLAVFATYQLARVGWTVPTTAHVLAGVAVSAAAGAAMSFLMMLSEERLLVIFAWLYGDFTSASWSKLGSVLPYVALSSLRCWPCRDSSTCCSSARTKPSRWACASRSSRPA
jgi:iron complex transport system permease protein